MDSPRSDALDSLPRLLEFARGGDWQNAAALAAGLGQLTVQRDGADMEEYLRLLGETLIVAKIWRSHAGASLARLNAAAKFNSTGKDAAAERHNFGV
jgi:hypothetical protein